MAEVHRRIHGSHLGVAHAPGQPCKRALHFRMAPEGRGANKRHRVVGRKVVAIVFQRHKAECVDLRARRVARNQVDLATGQEAVAIHQRSDVCAVPAAGVVAETMVALVLARAALEKFGGDSLTETRRNIAGYLRAVADREAFDGSASVLSG